MTARIVPAVGLAAFCALLAYVALSPEGKVMPTAPAIDQSSASPADCGRCHPDIYAQWRASQHALAWRDPVVVDLSQGFDKPECIPCHAPQPVFKTEGFGVPPARATARDSGVDCLTCHLGKSGLIGPRGNPTAPCRPAAEPRLGQSVACKPCHSSHGLYSEWQASSFAAAGVQCQGCHMPGARRPARPGRPARQIAQHSFAGGHSIDMVRRAASVQAQVQHGQVVVSVVNRQAGHNIPGELSIRVLSCETTILDSEGNIHSEYRAEFKAPPRYLRKVVRSDQIAPGQTVALRYEAPDAGTAVVVMKFKLLKFMLDREAQEVSRLSVPFGPAHEKGGAQR